LKVPCPSEPSGSIVPILSWTMEQLIVRNYVYLTFGSCVITWLNVHDTYLILSSSLLYIVVEEFEHNYKVG